LFLNPKLLLDLKSSHDCLNCNCFVQCHFRQKGIDKNLTSLSPCRLGVLSGFVFTSDQVHPEDSVVIGSVVRTHISHGFGVYSHVFGVSKGMVWTTNTKIRIKPLQH